MMMMMMGIISIRKGKSLILCFNETENFLICKKKRANTMSIFITSQLQKYGQIMMNVLK